MTEHLLQPHKCYLCLFTIEGHRTWRQMFATTVEKIEYQLKTNLGGHKIIQKKFFEIDLNTGTFEEF